MSGIAIATPFNAPTWYLLSWIGFIPLLWSLEVTSLAQAYRLGIICGVSSYAIACIWIIDFLQLFSGASFLSGLPISILFWLYCAHLPALLCMCYRWIVSHYSPSPILVFPTLVTTFYAAFPTMLSSHLGESQSYFIIALQAIDITGVHGLDFIIGLSNISLYLLLFSSFKQYQTSLTAATIVLVLWFTYGVISYQHWENKINQWPLRTIGLVQPNETPSAELPPPPPGYTRAYPPEMPMTKQLAQLGAEIIIWPETRYKGYFRYRHIKQAFSHQAKALDTPIVFQDTERTLIGHKEHLFNTAIAINESGNQSGNYRKYHRMPFGEYVPLIDNFSSLKERLHTKLDSFFTDYSRGEGPVTFQLNGLSLVPLICYEVMFSVYAAEAIGDQGSGKILIGLTNDGWFGKSLQPYQHINTSLLRSIENRVPLIHATNNGPSLVVSPSGRRLFQTAYHQQQALLAKIPYSKTSGGSFYSKHPGWFIKSIIVIFILYILFAIKNSHKQNTKAH